MAVVRIAPSKIDTSCKEAVADALLNIVGSRISGGGDFGRVVYGASPRSKIVSGFLLPRKNIDDGDEVTSPIWVSCHGLDLQIASTGSGVIKLHPKFSIYLRILPSEKDLTEREDCKLQFLLKKEIDKKIRLLIRDALNARWESIKDKYSSRRECLTWNAIKEDVRLQVLKENGIPSTIKTVLEDNVGLAQPLEQGLDSTNVADGVVVTTLGPEEQLKDELFDSLQIPHKWHRLDLTLPEFELNPYLPESELATAIKLHEDAMQGDGGDTFVTGSNPELRRCATDAREIFHLVRKHWAVQGATGKELYEYAVTQAELRGWKLNLDLSGHRIADFPHAAV